MRAEGCLGNSGMISGGGDTAQVKGADAGGMDEVSILGPTRVNETLAGAASELTLTPGDFGDVVTAEESSLEQLRGGDAVENAGILRGMLGGEILGAKRAMVVANAAAALVVANRSTDVADGAEQAAEAIDSGKATEVLKRWQEFSA